MGMLEFLTAEPMAWTANVGQMGKINHDQLVPKTTTDCSLIILGLEAS